ncbi:MAG: DUF4363 family protein [Ruminiclostridium sp.]|nr:DUF4363 family protein [Ruminiclostridium sp.]MBQ8842184.1 DUF4363 family protein [Ruminiclostridium sp.]
MKRIIICAFIMVIIIIIGIGSYIYTDNAMDRTEKAVDNISDSYLSGNLDEVKRLTNELSSEWRKQYRSYVFIFDKEHIMELTAMIARIEAFAEEENPEVLVECKAAVEFIRLYRAKEDITLGNIL